MWIVAVVLSRKETLQLELLGKPVPSPSDEEIVQQAAFDGLRDVAVALIQDLHASHEELEAALPDAVLADGGG